MSIEWTGTPGWPTSRPARGAPAGRCPATTESRTSRRTRSRRATDAPSSARAGPGRLTVRSGAAAVEALHRPTPAIVVEHDLVEAIAGVAPDRAPPEGGRGGVLGALAHLPRAAEAIEQRVRGALADAVTAVAAQHEELGHVEYRGIAREAARLHDQREAGERAAGAGQERVARGLGPVGVERRRAKAAIVADVEPEHRAEVVDVELEERGEHRRVIAAGGGDLDVHRARLSRRVPRPRSSPPGFAVDRRISSPAGADRACLQAAIVVQ